MELLKSIQIDQQQGSFCLAEFVTMYCKKISYDDNDFQSNNLPYPIDKNDSKLMEFPKLIKLSASGEILSRSNRKIAKYH